MQKVKIFDVDNIVKLQNQINDFIEEGHAVDQISCSSHANVYTSHYVCAILYHDAETGMHPTVEDIDVRR
jgi:hypothetical protein